MTNNTLLILLLSFGIYFAAGFFFLSNQKERKLMRVSIFNPYDKFNYQTSIKDKFQKNVISREEFEWLNVEKFSSSLK